MREVIAVQEEQEELNHVKTRNVITKFEVTSENIDSFIFTENRRKLRTTLSKTILSSLNAGRVFDEPIHVNFINNTRRIVEGNHRMDSLKTFLERNPDHTVEINLAEYYNLTPEEEKKLYDVLAHRTKQTINDFIKIHFDEVPVFHRVNNRFPIEVRIYSSSSNLSYGNLFNVWMQKEDANGLSGIRRTGLLNYCKSLKESDYNKLYQFFDILVSHIGEPSSINPYFKPMPMWLITSIYFRNNNVIEKEAIWKRINDKILGDFRLIDYSKARSREMGLELRKYLIDKMNKGWRHNHFV